VQTNAIAFGFPLKVFKGEREKEKVPEATDEASAVFG
jgi:hypothetical protein